MTSVFKISASGAVMGEYKGASEREAIDAFARDAGYDDFTDLLNRVPGSSRNDIRSLEIDVEKLTAAVEAASGQAVFQDNYGDGVALVAGNSYATYRELAKAFDLDIDDFEACKVRPPRRATRFPGGPG